MYELIYRLKAIKKSSSMARRHIPRCISWCLLQINFFISETKHSLVETGIYFELIILVINIHVWIKMAFIYKTFEFYRRIPSVLPSRSNKNKWNGDTRWQFIVCMQSDWKHWWGWGILKWAGGETKKGLESDSIFFLNDQCK